MTSFGKIFVANHILFSPQHIEIGGKKLLSYHGREKTPDHIGSFDFQPPAAAYTSGYKRIR
jgi:hypothetical protein